MRYDAKGVMEALAETCAKIGSPLTDDQYLVLLGGLHVYIDKVREQERSVIREAAASGVRWAESLAKDRLVR